MVAMIPEPAAIVEQRVMPVIGKGRTTLYHLSFPNAFVGNLSGILRRLPTKAFGNDAGFIVLILVQQRLRVDALAGLILYRQFFATLGARHNLDTGL